MELNGMRDAGVIGRAPANANLAKPGDRGHIASHGEVAEWLKATVC
jgi:hypothetical protein